MYTELQQASQRLHRELEHFPCLRAVGIGLVDGAAGILIYVSRDNKQVRQSIPERWEGFPVTARKMGAVEFAEC